MLYGALQTLDVNGWVAPLVRIPHRVMDDSRIRRAAVVRLPRTVVIVQF